MRWMQHVPGRMYVGQHGLPHTIIPPTAKKIHTGTLSSTNIKINHPRDRPRTHPVLLQVRMSKAICNTSLTRCYRLNERNDEYRPSLLRRHRFRPIKPRRQTTVHRWNLHSDKNNPFPQLKTHLVTTISIFTYTGGASRGDLYRPLMVNYYPLFSH